MLEHQGSLWNWRPGAPIPPSLLNPSVTVTGTGFCWLQVNILMAGGGTCLGSGSDKLELGSWNVAPPISFSLHPAAPPLRRWSLFPSP